MKNLINRALHPRLIIPLCLFILAKIFIILAAYQAGYDGLAAETYQRYDSGLYMEVAQHGHNLFPCGPQQGFEENSGAWCGNAGWAPLYPLMMRVVHELTALDFAHAGVLLSNLFFLAFLIAAAFLAGIKDYCGSNWILIGIIALCPGNIYYHAIFPLSLVAFLLTMLFYFLREEKYMLAGLIGFFAILSYSIGFFLIAAVALYAQLIFFRNRSLGWKVGLQLGLPCMAGLLFLFAYDQWSTGHWNALFLVQAKYGHALDGPLKLLGLRLNKLADYPFSLISWVEVQNMIVCLYVVTAVIMLWIRKKGERFRVFHILYMLFFWWIPFSLGMEVALYRNAAVLGPAHTAVKVFPLWSRVLILLIFIVLSWPLAQLYFKGAIV